MTQLFQEDGEVVVTAIEAGPCFVIQVKTEAKDGYNAVQLGFGEAKALSSPKKGHVKDIGQFTVKSEGNVPRFEAQAGEV